MLRNFIITTLLAISFNVYGEYHFKIIGSVFPELNGKVIHLKIEDSYSSDRFVKEDSVKIQNGFFSFEGTLRNVTEYATLSIFGKGYNYFRYIMVDSGNTVIKVMPVSANSLTKKNKLSNTIIENSESYKLAGKLDSLENYYYNHFATPTNYNSTILRLSKEMIFELSKAKLNLIRQFPNTFGSLIQLYIISNRQTLASDELMSVYLSLDSHIRESVLAINFRQSVRYRKSVEIGQPIGELKSNTSRDKQFTNKNLLGMPYLIAFGATWCKPCKEDYPILKKFYAKYKPLGFEIVSVNLHDQKKIWLSQIESYSLSWIHISELKKWEETQLAEIFNVKYVPYYILVDKNGIIRYNSILLKDFELKELENYIINCIK